MKLEKTNRAMKNILFIPRMKNGMIILKLLLVMYTVCARLELSDIKTIGETKVIEEDDLLIHPDGPLNPLRGYIMHKSGYMYNKRFYAPEIDTMYKLEDTGEVYDNRISIYNYTRKPVNDKAYKNICNSPARNEYFLRFHTQLINMFPCSDGALSIIAGRPDAPTSFLLKDELKDDCIYILAALFLLSEQVSISISAEIKEEGNEKLILKSANGSTIYVDQSLVIYKDKENSKEKIKTYHTETVKLINFMKHYAEDAITYVQQDGFIEPTNYGQFMEGKFLSTLQFLIQSYIYEFIDTKDKYIKFVEAVHTLLNDQITNNTAITKKKKKSYERVLSKCFVKEDEQSNEINHTAVICELKDTIDKYKIFPFMDSSQLPSYTRVKAYNRKDGESINDESSGEFINDESRKYSNCVETAIVGLFLCLVYDPETNRYNTDYLPNNEKTMPLKDFFRKYTEPAEVTDYTMHLDWCRVIADLKNDKILYLKEKTNELDSSLLNVLYVASDITGNNEEVVKQIKHIEELIADKNINDKIDVKESLTTIFKELSNNKNLEVECDEFTVGERKDKKLDLFGGFRLVYTFNRRKDGILVVIISGHSSLSLLEDSLSIEEKNIIKEKLAEIQNTYSNIESYTACIIKQYTNIELAKMEKETALGWIQESIRNNRDNINDIFLHGVIASVDQKTSIVRYFLAMYLNDNLSKNNSLVRFTNNLIGSTPLDDFQTREGMLDHCMLNKDSKGYYPGIESCWEEVTEISVYKLKAILIGIFVESNHPIDVTLECFKKLMKIVADESVKKYYVILESFLIEEIMKFSRKTNEPTKTLLELIKILDETVIQPDGSNMFVIYLRWIYDIFFSDYFSLDDKKQIIKVLMDKIDVNYKFNTNNMWDYFFIMEYSYVLKDLEMNKKDLFCDEEISESVEKYNCLMKKIREVIEFGKREFPELYDLTYRNT
ncbi:hypothetical protein NEIRO03_2321 [Nematocida sp. AWRm78]|nr:hypothetical protein NEIRO02_2302 [Nematocida sp. AWRm79]KAI5186552.1 hypothetical protein NEIRO03_2321 [Nematocida sp. AWRm78]